MKNLYPGINPHLNSVLQSPNGGWQSFDAEYIIKLMDELDQVLPENYYPVAERSIQIGWVNPDDPFESGSRHTRPDVLVLQKNPALSPTVAAAGRQPTLLLPALDQFDDDYDLTAIVIYHADTQRLKDKPILRLEVLSPANKPGGSHHDKYMSNRRQTLYSGLGVVELDWLHETPPLLSAIPSYPDGEPDAYPYSILVTDPYPTPVRGYTAVYGFRVSESIPEVNIPLAGGDYTLVDFGRVYNQTVEPRRVFARLTDYGQQPERFETYDELDRNYILQRMTEIANEQTGSEQ